MDETAFWTDVLLTYGLTEHEVSPYAAVLEWHERWTTKSTKEVFSQVLHLRRWEDFVSAREEVTRRHGEEAVQAWKGEDDEGDWDDNIFDD